MTEQQESVALVRRHVEVPATILSDDEMRRIYRVAESLHLSGIYDDVKKPEQAFVKMLLGRDLGLSPTQSLGGLHLVKGSVTVHYAMLARFINARQDEGYAYRAGWIKQSPEPETSSAAPTRDAVYMDEDDPLDMREIVGAFVVFTIGEQQVGVSRFTIEDAVQAGLVKEGMDVRAAWVTSRRNMYLARAMSNGVKWFIPEVMGGLPVYVDGEIVPERASVTDPVGDGDDEGTGVDLGPKVDEMIARATALGHRGLSNRAALELQLGKRSPGVITQFVKDAHTELTRFEAEKAAAAAEGTDEPPEAEVVEPEAVVTEDDVAEEQTKLDPDMPSATGPNHEAPEATAERREAAANQLTEDAVTRARLKALREAREDEQNPEQRALIDEEIDMLEETLALGDADAPEKTTTDTEDNDA